MARCPFAKWMPISGPVGPYAGGPFRIVHHTTEGNSASGAMQAFRANRSDPHFTVDETNVYQHIDTGLAARALRHMAGQIETNRLSAVQIEIVGTAGRPKARPTLDNVARLCRWLEATHRIPAIWPSGPPKPAVNGSDPGGHNRNPQTWVSKGGHYGHCHVPENVHWDPGYTPQEAEFVIRYDPDHAGLVDPELETLRESFPEKVELQFDDISIPDHADVGEGEDAGEPAPALSAPAIAAPGRLDPADMAVVIGALFFAGTYLLARLVGQAGRR